MKNDLIKRADVVPALLKYGVIGLGSVDETKRSISLIEGVDAEQEPRVMTREEIEGSDGTEFYSEHKGEEYLYMDHTEGPAYIMGNMERFSLKRLRWEDYGKTWRCWNARPSPEQMRDTPWEDTP